MRRLIVVLAVLAAGAELAPLPAGAQQERRGPTTERDVLPLGQQILPAPDSRRIVVPFGESTKIHFKLPFKSIRIADPYSIGAVPESDHVITFTGISPGTSRFTLEAGDGSPSTSGEVIVVREVHEVKIYVPAKTDNGIKNANMVIYTGAEGSSEAKKSAEAEYSSRLCNEVSCRPVPEAAK